MDWSNEDCAVAQRLVGVLRHLADTIERRQIPTWVMWRLVGTLAREAGIAEVLRGRLAAKKEAA
jgi:hypothetical protein